MASIQWNPDRGVWESLPVATATPAGILVQQHVSVNVEVDGGASSTSSATAASTTTATVTTASLLPTTTEPASLPPTEPWVVDDRYVISYWGRGKEAEYSPIDAIPWTGLTHINYAFVAVGENATLVFADEPQFAQFVQAADAHDVHVVMSLGGWNVGSKYFSPVVQSQEGIDTLVADIVRVRNIYNFTGVDIDWEFVGQTPGGTEVIANPATDSDGYLALLQAMRTAMPDLEISAAVPAWMTFTGPDGNSLTNMTAYAELFTYINIMAYDLGSRTSFGYLDENGDELPYTGSNAALNITRDQSSCVSGVQIWRDAGFPPEKIVLGCAFYGRSWVLQDPTSPLTNGTFNLYSKTGFGDADEAGSGVWKWRNLLSQSVVAEVYPGSQIYEPGAAWEGDFDPESLTPYVFNTTTGDYISYDDPYSLSLKRNFAATIGLKGVMFWQTAYDTPDGQLTQILART